MTADHVTRRGLMQGGGALLAAAPLASPAQAATTASVSKGAPMTPVELTVNGREVHLQLDPRTSLLDALREHLKLTGTKKGCDHGQCGACTVIVEGRRINSCLTLAVMHDGEDVTTIEGLGTPEALHPMQKAFIVHDGYQCGYCTPGQICSAQGLINEGTARTREDVREMMSGNLCRCGAYTNIADAVLEVLEQEAGA